MFNKFPQSKYQQGQAILLSVLFLTIISVVVVVGLVGPTIRGLHNASNSIISRGSYYAAEAGVEDVVYRLKNGLEVSDTNTISLNNGTATINVVDGEGQTKTISAAGVIKNLYRKLETTLVIGGSGQSFHYGIQAGNGGLTMAGNSIINGNVYSNGTIVGAGSGNGGSIIRGTAVSAGSSGKIQAVRATSTAHAHTITNAKIDGDAYYTTISGSTVSGTSYPGSPDQATTSFPISDEQIAVWENEAASSSVVASPCPYNLSGAVSIGPAKIDCSVTTSNNTTITLTGNLWIKGTFTPGNNTIFKVDPSLSGKTVAIIVDDPSNRTTASKINVSNNISFQGSGTNSYVMIIVMNNSAENGGSVVAIDVSNNDAGDYIAYAPHGLIDIKNNAHLVEATGYKINLNNNVVIDYESGLTSLLFDSGPSAGFEISGWQETP